jgi:hypothetical protein
MGSVLLAGFQQAARAAVQTAKGGAGIGMALAQCALCVPGLPLAAPVAGEEMRSMPLSLPGRLPFTAVSLQAHRDL